MTRAEAIEALRADRDRTAEAGTDPARLAALDRQLARFAGQTATRNKGGMERAVTED